LRGQDGEAASFTAGPVMLFSLLIAVLWAWSLFTHPQTRCTRCTSTAPHLRPWHTRTSGTCPKCGGTGTRERLEVAGSDEQPPGDGIVAQAFADKADDPSFGGGQAGPTVVGRLRPPPLRVAWVTASSRVSPGLLPTPG
jgi:hypothetical protein